MALLVLAFPKIDEKDFKWIQTHREIFDLLYFHVVDPHFTIVFPTSGVTEKDFTSEIIELAGDFPRFNFTVRSATVNKDSFVNTYHTFLVPDEGNSNIIKLHDKLYSRLLKPHHLIDIDFIPHMGIGNSKDVTICKVNADKINSMDISIKGIIDDLSIVRYENGRIEIISEVPLC